MVHGSWIYTNNPRGRRVSATQLNSFTPLLEIAVPTTRAMKLGDVKTTNPAWKGTLRWLRKSDHRFHRQGWRIGYRRVLVGSRCNYGSFLLVADIDTHARYRS